MGSVGRNMQTENRGGHVTEDQFFQEASRQGFDGNELEERLEEYVASSYGATSLGIDLTRFIENAPKNMMYNDGTLYRGLVFNSQQELDNFLSSHKVGDTLDTRLDGMSWTASESVAQEFSTNAGDYSVVLVNNDTDRIAMGIKNIADTPVSSEEVLYSNRVDFTVNKVEKRGTTTYLHVKQKRSKK